MPNIGSWELVILVIILLVVFGLGRTSEVARELGGVIREFRGGKRGKKESTKKEPVSPPPTEEVGWQARLERALTDVAKAMSEGLTLAAALVTLLEVFNVSSYRLAEETGLERSTITRLLKGETKKPQKETLLRILEVFPTLPSRWREELLALAGFPPDEATPSLTHPPQVYLSCHGEGIVDERRIVADVLGGSRSLFGVEVAEATWAEDEVAASVSHSDYLVMVQGWEWVPLRRAEHRAVQRSGQVTALYFQKEGVVLRPEVEQFLEEVGKEQWQPFSDADALAWQVWMGLWETLTREARAGRARVSLRSAAAIYLVGELLTGEEPGLAALLERLVVEREEVERAASLLERREEQNHPMEPEMVRVPAGWFWMGSERLAMALTGIRWKKWYENEMLCHHIFLPSYAIGKYPVTNAEFARFIEDRGYAVQRYWTRAGWKAKEHESWSRPRRWDNEKYNAPSQPVIVYWYEAVAYCNWLSEVTGRPYRLPTEAEWEKASRGSDRRIYPWGNKWIEGCANTREAEVGHTTPAGAFPRGVSPYGALDMIGNVWEWCSSLHWEYPYQDDDGREDLEAVDYGYRVIRGGSWSNSQWLARCACRGIDFHGPSNFDNDVGFRVVLPGVISQVVRRGGREAKRGRGPPGPPDEVVRALRDHMFDK
jgi:formylglycine-generating enzyme required for sulfatase activity/Sec-independent protein translocase protein TatA/transcriptional regulator with XRE-family HTH domain